MKKHSKKLLYLFIVLILGWSSLLALPSQHPKLSQELKVHFIDVGQADCILIQTPKGKNIMIDFGNNDDAETITQYLKDRKIKKLDVIVGTHPHEDHIGSMDTIINTFDIGMIYMPKVVHSTRTYEDVLKAVKNKKLKVTTAKADVDIKVDELLNIKMLSPIKDKYENLNDYSPIIKLTYGKMAFLFTGDAEAIVEQALLNKKIDVNVDVLKVGHHGSHSSSTDAFIKAVSPTYSVISCGVDNSYGHPHKETIDTLKKYNTSILRTDIDGTIVITSDDKKLIEIKKNKKGTSTQTKTTKIFITKTGDKYHRSTCDNLNKSQIPIKLEDAKKKGYTPCAKCKP